MNNNFNKFNDFDKKQEENFFRCDDFIEENLVRSEMFRHYALQSFYKCKVKFNDIKMDKRKNAHIDKYKNINI